MIFLKKLSEEKSLTDKIDSILINKFLGLPIFLFLMWGLFQLTFELGNIPMDLIDALFASLSDKTKEIFGNTELASLLADGIIAGVGAVVLFLPNIVILFLGIALLETTGYMSRVAFLLDGFLSLKVCPPVKLSAITLSGNQAPFKKASLRLSKNLTEPLGKS